MLKFLSGVVVGAGGLYLYSSKIREKVKETNAQLEQYLENRELLSQDVDALIMEKIESGRVDELIQARNVARHQMKTIDSIR